MAMATSDMTSPNRCQLYTKFNLSEAIKDSGDPEKITNTSILQFLIDSSHKNAKKLMTATLFYFPLMFILIILDVLDVI